MSLHLLGVVTVGKVTGPCFFWNPVIITSDMEKPVPGNSAGDLFGMVKKGTLSKVVGVLQLGDENVKLNHLVVNILWEVVI